MAERQLYEEDSHASAAEKHFSARSGFLTWQDFDLMSSWGRAAAKRAKADKKAGAFGPSLTRLSPWCYRHTRNWVFWLAAEASLSRITWKPTSSSSSRVSN